jgi:hypothetical protein
MARFYANENLPLPVVEELRRLGHDVLTTQESGRSGQALPDIEVLRFAAFAERTVVTLNRKHFVRLHQEFSAHCGIIVCSFDIDYVALAQRIDKASHEQVDLHGALVRINRPG